MPQNTLLSEKMVNFLNERKESLWKEMEEMFEDFKNVAKTSTESSEYPINIEDIPKISTIINEIKSINQNMKKVMIQNMIDKDILEEKVIKIISCVNQGAENTEKLNKDNCQYEEFNKVETQIKFINKLIAEKSNDVNTDSESKLHEFITKALSIDVSL